MQNPNQVAQNIAKEKLLNAAYDYVRQFAVDYLAKYTLDTPCHRLVEAKHSLKHSYRRQFLYEDTIAETAAKLGINSADIIMDYEYKRAICLIWKYMLECPINWSDAIENRYVAVFTGDQVDQAQSATFAGDAIQQAASAAYIRQAKKSISNLLANENFNNEFKKFVLDTCKLPHDQEPKSFPDDLLDAGLICLTLIPDGARRARFLA